MTDTLDAKPAHSAGAADSGLLALGLALGAVVVALGVLLAPMAARLHVWWTTGMTYTHGYLVLGMCAWLTWDLARDRGQLRFAPVWPMLVIVAGVAVAYGLVTLLSIDVLQHVMLPVLLGSVAWAIGGRDALRIALPALVMLYFALPIWDPLEGLLQRVTTAVVRLPLLLHDFAVVFDGFYVTVPSGDFHIAGGCSGLHYVLVAIIIAVFFAATETRNRGLKMRIVGLALILSLVTNWVRVYSLILIGQYTRMQHYLIAVDHKLYGWVIFAVAMAAFFVVARRWTAADTGRSRAGGVSVHRDVGKAAVLVAIVMLGIGTASLFAARQPQLLVTATTPQSGITAYARTIGDWRPVQAPLAQSHEGAGIYRGMSFEWFVALYPAQGPTLDLMSSDHRDFGPAWRSVDILASGDAYRVLRIKNDAAGNRLVAVRKRVAGEIVQGKLSAKWTQLIGLLTWNRSADFAAVSTDCLGECSEEAEAFEALATQWFSNLTIGQAN